MYIVDELMLNSDLLNDNSALIKGLCPFGIRNSARGSKIQLTSIIMSRILMPIVKTEYILCAI